MFLFDVEFVWFLTRNKACCGLVSHICYPEFASYAIRIFFNTSDWNCAILSQSCVSKRICNQGSVICQILLSDGSDVVSPSAWCNYFGYFLLQRHRGKGWIALGRIGSANKQFVVGGAARAVHICAPTLRVDWNIKRNRWCKGDKSQLLFWGAF